VRIVDTCGSPTDILRRLLIRVENSTMSTAPKSSIPGRIITIPNVICGLRLIAAPGLIVLALAGRPGWFLAY